MERGGVSELDQLVCKARRYVVLMAGYDPGIHLGSSLSVMEIVAALYGTGRVKFNVGNGAHNRNYFVLSKGHAIHAVYALAAAMGYLTLDELRETGSLGSRLQNHPEVDTPFVDVPNSGSLGQGISLAVGLALGLRLKGERGRVYLVVGDGELDEGQSWESFAVAAHYNLANLVTIVDLNGVQLDGHSEEVLRKGDLAGRFKSLGFEVFEVDGHDVGQLISALERAEKSERPAVIIAKTVRGKGVPAIEDTAKQRLSRDDALKYAGDIC
ncbi:MULTISPECIES: transketolase [Pyrobaculum]|uniref:2-oxoacid oxidoreductase (ferredoxin) n=3 Tax=Pyrobaculum TaxID=2276 RepID=A4WMN8_PYRAR|nr:transketolase [Pyrobaculum arsenaticum]ABP51655.1 transketolase subunit A [Pyrobaculum arsenaticum DSM 13514]MCY0890696.1 transketolase [Pyrobaculum arsenaticum]NYR15975.1 transketolase [Pyrobaculum arsenaticum]